jgi:folate-dependent phosphoribosylglycinamide formyltransferase PurN
MKMTKRSKYRMPAKKAEAPAVQETTVEAAPVVQPAEAVAEATAAQPSKKPAGKGPTKKQRVYDMCASESGATVKGIAEALDISPIAARSLIGDLRRAQVKVDQDKGVYRILA